MSDSVNEVGGEKDSGRAGRALSFLAKLFAIAAVFVSAGGVFLHLCGNVAQSTYLRAFNVDSDGFSRGADWMMVNGYYSTIQSGVLVIQSAFTVMSLGAIAYVTILVAVVRYRPRKQELPECIRHFRNREWVRRFLGIRGVAFMGANVAIAGVLYAVGFSLMCFALLLVLVPGLVGEKFAKDEARKDVQSFKAGCVATHPCSELWSGGKKIAAGFVIATTSERIAFFDVQLKMIRQLERSGVEVRSPINPKFDSAN